VTQSTQRTSGGQWKIWISVAALCAIQSGCGGTYNATVSGVVALDGNKLTRGTVAFNPSGEGVTAYARIENDGSYVVKTGREKGLPAGEYSVTVVAHEDPENKVSSQGGPPPPGKHITPKWYRSIKTSGLKYQVEAGANEIDIQLSAEPPPGYNEKKRRRR
jgi:hypothetical protein